MMAPVPCSFGSKALFANVEARKHAEDTFHKYEWASLYLVQAANLTPRAKLALRIVTTIQANNVKEVVKQLKHRIGSTTRSMAMTENGNSEIEHQDENENLRKRAINLLALGKYKTNY